MTNKRLLIAGGGIGGLAAALAASRAGWQVQVYERTPEFSEVGAGIQIGPNVVRVLQQWGLEHALREVAAFPDRLQIRSALSGALLGTLPLGARAVEKYGAPYATIHRADIHRLLRLAVERQAQAPVSINLNQWLADYTDGGQTVTLTTVRGMQVEGDALIGADGLWSRVRQILLAGQPEGGPPRVAGHLAYRTMLVQDRLPAALRSHQVTAWLGPKLHVVQYPVHRGEWMNVVAIIHGEPPVELESWDHNANAAELELALAHTCKPLQDLIAAVPAATRNPVAWRLWALCDRAPVSAADQMARGRVALLGDAAHPMRPYLAQGAGMAIEDAAELERVLRLDTGVDTVTRLQRYASARWQRCARVQARSIRNGTIYHATGLMRLGRDSAIRLLGQSLLDMPWLYRS